MSEGPDQQQQDSAQRTRPLLIALMLAWGIGCVALDFLTGWTGSWALVGLAGIYAAGFFMMYRAGLV